MRLKDPLRSPVGGWYFDDPLMNRRIGGRNKRDLVNKVNNFRAANDSEEVSEQEIEDQICMRQPPERCWYQKKLGDQIARAVHLVAGAVDKVAGTKLEKKARRCGGCAKRRNKLNR